CAIETVVLTVPPYYYVLDSW
nr:immunoglobulin heavy chain junction region [Macaca mulatta]MOW46028.1 immunoglobulin heavy chain junction region [Macaca mulatta]MOW46785.1 immunoglobulin heavy chain junction region [Macaca mulatta]MOW47021.1 immunoglobulin heavy chain junction region [Macaca mulatta]MOW47532.1 immunoglobulin heavy chain junction region [Macaca mulatta]